MLYDLGKTDRFQAKAKGCLSPPEELWKSYKFAQNSNRIQVIFSTDEPNLTPKTFLGVPEIDDVEEHVMVLRRTRLVSFQRCGCIGIHMDSYHNAQSPLFLLDDQPNEYEGPFQILYRYNFWKGLRMRRVTGWVFERILWMLMLYWKKNK